MYEEKDITDVEQLMMTGLDKTDRSRYEKVYSRLLKERMIKAHNKLKEINGESREK